MSYGDASGGVSLLQLNASAPPHARSGASASASASASFRDPSEMYSAGGDPDFRRHATHTYLCDAANCDELKCKCRRYCRCRGVPVPLFEGEDDANSRGLPAPATESGYWPWYPKLYSTYMYNTDPPTSRGGSGPGGG